jgi:hypothetical protein
MSYKSVKDDVDSDASGEGDDIDAIVADHYERRNPTRRQRCLDFMLCRHNSAMLLVLLDLAYLISTIWTFADIIVVLSAHNVLGFGGDWWFYIVLGVPVLLQLIGIIMRLRYAFSGSAAHADIDWQLRHVSRPLTMIAINGIAFDVYLFALPLYASALLEDANGSELGSVGVVEFGAMWNAAMIRPSNIAFSILFIVLMLANWRVSSKHRWRVKAYVAHLKNNSDNWERLQDVRPTGMPPATDGRPTYGTATEMMPMQTATMVLPESKTQLFGTERRIAEARTTFVAEVDHDDDYNNGKPPAGGKKRAHKSKRNVDRARAVAATGVSTSATSLDGSARSADGVNNNERW